jgi:hypothetical protein
MSLTATYSPEDNKLRLYASARLDKGLYDRVKSAGFKWAPKQDLFVAPMWTPGREDLLIELCGEIDDEDQTLIDRAEERSERFEEYSTSRNHEAEQAQKSVAAIMEHIPFGQPILVGHHSERHARRDVERIDNGMRKAVSLFNTAEYWERRAAAAISHAKYKERPDVRARRIKSLEADKRKRERSRDESAMWLKLWTECKAEEDTELQRGVALRIAGMGHLQMPRKEGDREDFNQQPSAYDALQGSFPNLYAPRSIAEVIEVALDRFPKFIAYAERWVKHFTNRLNYERAMLADSGGTVSDRTGPEKEGACRCWASPRGGWSYIQKVNKVSVTVLDNYGNGGGNFTRTMPFDKLLGVMTAAQVQEKREAGQLLESQDKIGFFLTAPPTFEAEPTPESAPHKDLEQGLRQLRDAQGVPKERQDEILADVTSKAQPGAQIGPFTLTK